MGAQGQLPWGAGQSEAWWAMGEGCQTQTNPHKLLGSLLKASTHPVPREGACTEFAPGFRGGSPKDSPSGFTILCLAGDPSDSASSPPPQGSVSPCGRGSVFLGHPVPHSWKGAPQHSTRRGKEYVLVQEPVSRVPAFHSPG